jgi:hypothetical protein
MLKILNLYTISKIFENAERKISSRAKMLYINCLMHYFKDKSATVSNAVAFELFEEDFKDYEKYKTLMQELHKAGLISIGIKSITFNNVWGKHIDRTQLEKVNPVEYVAGFSFNGIEHFEKDLKQNSRVFEIAQMKHKIKKEDVLAFIDSFILEQKAIEKKYTNHNDCVKHFIYWLPNQVKQMPKQAENKIKSNNKILGI